MALPTTEARIEECERQLGWSLPPPLRARLLRENGGDVEADDDTWQLHPVWDPSDVRTSKRSANHVLRETTAAREWTSFPDDVVAIASNGTGDRLIARRGSNDIEFWDHETGQTHVVDVAW